MNALKFFVDLSQPWKQGTEVSITREVSIKSYKIVDDNTENHSRQRRSFSLENPTKSRPKLVTNLDLSETKEIFEVRAEEMNV